MGKNIIALSDGTGNAASSIWRTNVWRTFQALDPTTMIRWPNTMMVSGPRASSLSHCLAVPLAGASSKTCLSSTNSSAATTIQTTASSCLASAVARSRCGCSPASS